GEGRSRRPQPSAPHPGLDASLSCNASYSGGALFNGPDPALCRVDEPDRLCIATIKKERSNHLCFATRARARHAIFEYIAVFYKRERLHSTLDYRNPIEYELLHTDALHAA